MKGRWVPTAGPVCILARGECPVSLQRLGEPVTAADAALAEPLAAGSCGHVHGSPLPHPAGAAPARESPSCPTPLPWLLGRQGPNPPLT